jgi:hypothetical protein
MARDCPTCKWTTREILAEHDVYMLQFADSTGADHFDCQSKALVAALP